VAALSWHGDYAEQARLPRERRGEILVFWGRSGPGVTVRLFTNLGTGTWTILRVLGSSIARIEDGGRDARQDVGH
jgi:hypothetical protein